MNNLPSEVVVTADVIDDEDIYNEVEFSFAKDNVNLSTPPATPVKGSSRKVHQYHILICKVLMHDRLVVAKVGVANASLGRKEKLLFSGREIEIFLSQDQTSKENFHLPLSGDFFKGYEVRNNIVALTAVVDPSSRYREVDLYLPMGVWKGGLILKYDYYDNVAKDIELRKKNEAPVYMCFREHVVNSFNFGVQNLDEFRSGKPLILEGNMI